MATGAPEAKLVPCNVVNIPRLHKCRVAVVAAAAAVCWFYDVLEVIEIFFRIYGRPIRVPSGTAANESFDRAFAYRSVGHLSGIRSVEGPDPRSAGVFSSILGFPIPITWLGCLDRLFVSPSALSFSY